MTIANWIFQTAELDDKAGVATKDGQIINFTNDIYEDLLKKYGEGKLDSSDSDTLEEIEYLRDLINVATAKLVDSLGSPKIEAAKPATKELDVVEKVEKPEKPEIESVPPKLPTALPERKKTLEKLPGKPSEPQSTKWKEVRFNKREGKWQIITTQRKSYNFNTEAEALEFAKNI